LKRRIFRPVNNAGNAWIISRPIERKTMGIAEVELLGIAAVRLRSDQATVYIDAFTDLAKSRPAEEADLILITHADGDHFNARETARAAAETGAMVIGPPSIAYPLLADAGLPSGQLRIIYPPHFKKPVREQPRGIALKIYQTRHFNDWEPDHVSYLVDLGGKRLYITGDSDMIDEADPELQQLDAILFSMVLDSSKKDDPGAHVALLEKVQRDFHPRYVIPNHLIDCDWTIDPAILGKAIETSGLKGIVTIEKAEQAFEIP
jgi:L-ascorbate metabolism protein UlaG (beta-lactamase superfamily)